MQFCHVCVGVEYIVSDKIFESLPPDEQKLWHSHAYEIKAGLWVNPRIPEMIGQPELQNLAKTYGKFWCTWQVDRGKSQDNAAWHMRLKLRALVFIRAAVRIIFCIEIIVTLIRYMFFPSKN